MLVLGISGSPVNNSNTDRLVKTVLEATGLDHEFINFQNTISIHAELVLAVPGTTSASRRTTGI